MRKQPTYAPAADPEERPLPRKDFLAPQELVPGLLMTWDFCSTYRQACLRKPLSLCQRRGCADSNPVSYRSTRLVMHAFAGLC